MYKRDSGTVEVYRASATVLEDYRENFTIEGARALCKSDRAAYSMVNLYSGACIDALCGIRALFKPYFGADKDKACRKLYRSLTLRDCYGEVGEIDYSKVVARPDIACLTSPCPDFSSGSPNPKGARGDKGGNEFVTIPITVQKLSPRIVFIEMVGNVISFPDEVVDVLMGLQDVNNMAVHAAVVTMQQYGDIENCSRLVIVGIDKALGTWAESYRIPMGEFSDAVSYCAEDVATATEEIPERFHRWMKDYDVLLKANNQKPGKLQKVGQTGPGQGFSTAPRAVYDLKGLPPKCTTHGAGRHKPLGWRSEHGHRGKTYMFTPEDVARHKNLSWTVLEWMREIYLSMTPTQVNHLDADGFLYKCLGNGITMKFGHAIYTSLHTLLLKANIPFSILSSALSQDGHRVVHHFGENSLWDPKKGAALDACVTEVSAALLREVSKEDALKMATMGNFSGNSGAPKVYTMTLDTGATEMLCWDEQDRFLKDKRPANANIIGVKTEMSFSASSRGRLAMACIVQPGEFGQVATSEVKRLLGKRQWGSANQARKEKTAVTIMESDVITAPRRDLRKQLAGFPRLFISEKLNLDLRQAADGISAMWKYDPQFPGDSSRRWEVPLRWNACESAWQFDYMPLPAQGSDKYRGLVNDIHRDRLVQCSEASVIQESKLLVSATEVDACVIELLNNDYVRTLENVNLPEDFNAVMDKLDKDNERLEVIYARHADDCEIRGTKNTLPKKDRRNMTEQEFHEHYGHMGSGQNCVLCYMVKGCMRFITKVVAKYIEVRMGYFFDMDTLTVDQRAHDGTKYYTLLRCRGSKCIKSFPLLFRDNLYDQFELWLERQRSDPIYAVYNWNFCTVIRADNDGVWMRKSQRWLDICDKFNIRMWYTDKDRKESNSHAESLVNVVEKAGRSGLWQMGLPGTDHVDSFEAAVWLLNRFPRISALGRDPPDGDCIRPIEQISYGWYSRQQINGELARYVQPGTLVLAHMGKVPGSSVDIPKSEWVVAKGMLRKQLVVYAPITKQERKIDSYTLVRGKQGVNWRDALDIPYAPPHAARRRLGDDEADAAARRDNRLINLVMPKKLKEAMSLLKKQKAVNMIKHVHEPGTQTIKPPDVEHLIKMVKMSKCNRILLAWLMVINLRVRDSPAHCERHTLNMWCSQTRGAVVTAWRWMPIRREQIRWRSQPRQPNLNRALYLRVSFQKITLTTRCGVLRNNV
jgi:site-specific DNA-cytosine methylase